MPQFDDKPGSAPTLAGGSGLSEHDEIALQGTLLASRWKDRGVTPDLLHVDLKGTVGRGYATAAGVLPPDADDIALDAIKAAPRGAVVLGDVIGEGAMGVVRTGEQPHLRRTVAVKEPRGEATNQEAIGAMLREAWIGGNLEHPNIVPIHLLSRQGDKPLIVMKRIEGRAWSDILAEEAVDEGEGGVPADRLEHHLALLMEVCLGVHFAHSKHVLHLDLKPDNVMVGEFGEVYVLDWGIAAGFGDERPDWMPDAAKVRDVVGTPGYLSPEQAEGAGERFGPHTDVYLLGAIAHEIISGERLHTGPLVACLLSSYKGKLPEYGDDVPPELAAIILRAVDPDPEVRYPSAEAFRLALEAFITHRRSNELTRYASEKLGRIEELDAESSSSGIDWEIAQDYENTVTETRFAFQQALRIWPGNEAAREGLGRMLSLVVERACEAGDLRSAAEALSEHPRPTAELKQQVEALKTRLRAERADAEELRALGGRHDPNRFRTQRVRLAWLSAFSWFIWNMTIGWLDKQDIIPLTHEFLMANAILSALSYWIAIRFIGREFLMATEINRRAVNAIWGGFVATAMLWIGVWGTDTDPHLGAAMANAVYASGAGCLAIMVDKRIWFLMPLTLPSLIGATLDPLNAFEWTSLIGLIGGTSLVWLWREGGDTAMEGADG